ncbi:hypothetical protein BDW59DRAFT_144860 [Aspergillus cavernicola]|uniref:FAD-binding domain-containing protein n=1 Tax=Aspergillus cavernicola TaxID=176166 RepID=A0ABR4IGH1_9EURO
MGDLNKVLIIGGGPTGIAAALLLKQNNHLTPVVYDASTKPTTLGGAIGIPPNGLRLLKRLGIYEELVSRGSSAEDITVHSVQGSVMGRTNMVSWSKNKTGFGLLKIKRADLMDVFCKAARRSGIQIHYGKNLVGIKESNQQITASFSDGTSDTADFLLGCDGIPSSVRKLYVDPEIQPEYTGISDFYSLVPAGERPTAGPLKGLHATFTMEGMFAITTCTESSDEHYWFLSYGVDPPVSVVKRTGGTNSNKSMSTSSNPYCMAFCKNVKGEWGSLLRGFVGESKEVKFHPIFSLPLGGVWYKARCLLLGDAAHAVSPHASQGVSMALENDFSFLSST